MTGKQKSWGSLTVIPGRASDSKILQVVLFNRGAKNINKASYQDTLIAQAHCVGLFNREINFQLWEDDAPGAGHHAEINKHNQMPGVFKARVDKNGIAEAKIPLTSNPRVMQAIADKFLMKGDKDEGAYHEYYVTASYEGKIRGASQVNVNVANPAPHTKPKENSAIFPGTSAKSPRSDQEQKITHAYFVDLKGNPLTQVKVGDTVRVRIRTANMREERIQFVIWEYDLLSNDRIYESAAITIKGDSMDMPAVTITPALFNKGIDTKYANDPDQKRQQYFIEVIPLELKASSSKFGLADGAAKSLEVVRSASVVKNPQIDKAEKNKNKCPRCEANITYDQIVQIFPSSSKNEKLARELIKELNDIKIQYGINTCLKKAHMVTQMGSETEFRTLREEIDGYSINTLKSLFGYFKRHPDEAVKYHGDLYQIAIRAYGLRKVDKEKDIVSCSISNVSGCNDLGNESKEDGYTYIGRGLIQLTGKYQYTQINKSFQKAFPNKGDLVANPELLEQPKYAVMSGLSYWINNNLNEKAQKGSDGGHVDSLTSVINKNLDESHYKRRRNFFAKAKTVFKIDECTNRKKEEKIDNGVEVVFDKGTNKAVVSEKSINILKKIAKASNNSRIVITSTARTPLEQAMIMHDQTIEKGVQAQKILYGSNGDLVIDVYVYQKSLGKTKEEIIKKMEDKINDIGPSKVSRHCGNQNILNVFDVSSRRMQNASSFLKEARKFVGKDVSVVLNETDRNCYHFEIPQ